MKKLALVICCMFALSSLSFAMPGPKHEGGPKPGMDMYGFKDKETKEEREARWEKMEALKKEHMEFKKDMDTLIEKYNGANDKKKIEVKKEIRDLIASKTDKDIAIKKNILEDQKARIQNFEERIADLENNKDKYIDEKVEFFTSPEGQAKMKEMCEKMEKDNPERYKERGRKGDKPSKKHK